jgi:hypothetical protein
MGQIFFKNHYTVFDMTHADDTTASGQYHLLGVNFKRTQFTPVEEEVVPVVDEKAKWWEPIEEQWIKIE